MRLDFFRRCLEAEWSAWKLVEKLLLAVSYEKCDIGRLSTPY